MLKREIIQPLTLDITRFKQRYKQLTGLTHYERANWIATEHKRAKWAAYRPLAKEQLYDSLDEITTTILSPYANYSSKRSTKGGVLYAQATVVHRPTELLAIAHALALYKFPSEDIVIRQDPGKVVWYCIHCRTFKPLTEFAPEKHNVHGLSFACKRCEQDINRGVWRKAA